MAAKSQKRIYKITKHSKNITDLLRETLPFVNKELSARINEYLSETQQVMLVNAYNSWQSTAYAVRDDVSCEVCSTIEALQLTKDGIEVKSAVKAN